MPFGEIGAIGAIAADQLPGAPNALGAVGSRAADEVLRDTLAYQVGNRTLFLAREGFQRPQLLLGELNLCAYHDVSKSNMMAF